MIYTAQDQAKTVNILLVEDNEDDVIMIRDIFEEQNMVNVVGVAEDGEIAMSYLRKEDKYADAQTPELVLLDINMPKKNGFEVLEEMKRDDKLKHIPVIMLTTSGRPEDIKKAYETGASTYVMKRVAWDEFSRAVEQFSVYWTKVAKIPVK